jgi:hypothetical protein
MVGLSDTPEGYRLGIDVIRKLHPGRLILRPTACMTAEEIKAAEEEALEDLRQEYREKGYID